MEEKNKHSILNIIRNKYFIASILFLVWIAFFDEHSFVAHKENKRRLKYLKEQQVYYKNNIATDQRKLQELNAGKEELEKYAREQFNMSKPNEDLFLVVQE